MLEPPPAVTRAQARAVLRQRRDALDPAFVASASATLTKLLRTSPYWQQAKTVVAFVGVKGEPDTRALLAAALAEQRDLWLPQVRDGGMTFGPLARLSDLVPAKFGLWEPPVGPASPSRGLLEVGPALILVPGIGFTRAGDRLGFGRGYYDRALAEVRHDRAWIKVGICFAEALDPVGVSFPRQAHDVPMDHIATEEGIVNCGGT